MKTLFYAERPRPDVYVLQLAGHQRHQVGGYRKLHGELEDAVLFGVRTPRRTHEDRHAIRDLPRTTSRNGVSAGV